MSQEPHDSESADELSAFPEGLILDGDEGDFIEVSLPSPSTRPAPSTEPMNWVVPDDAAGDRLDAFLARVCPRYSRVQLRRAITELGVKVDGKFAKPAFRLIPGQRVDLVPPAESPTGSLPEAIPLTIVFEDRHIAVVDKPAGMVVHPARGHWSGTLTAALAYHFENLSTIGGATRPGIVHRLDRDTSGLILVAKSDAAHLSLAEQFEKRLVQKEYWALVTPPPVFDRDRIATPIGPHPSQREKMAVRLGHPDARPALTEYEVSERFRGIAEIKALPKTGRTHQIRVHLASVGFPILADRLYSGRASLTLGDLSGDRSQTEVVLARQALHARRLSFRHPIEGHEVTFESPLPEDLQRTLELLRQHRRT